MGEVNFTSQLLYHQERTPPPNQKKDGQAPESKFQHQASNLRPASLQPICHTNYATQAPVIIITLIIPPDVTLKHPTHSQLLPFRNGSLASE